jgi:hypothetical protein
MIALQAIPGVPKITEGYNPATWMLEVSSPLAEARLDMNFAEIYANSSLYRYVTQSLNVTFYHFN